MYNQKIVSCVSNISNNSFARMTKTCYIFNSLMPVAVRQIYSCDFCILIRGVQQEYTQCHLQRGVIARMCNYKLLVSRFGINYYQSVFSMNEIITS